MNRPQSITSLGVFNVLFGIVCIFANALSAVGTVISDQGNLNPYFMERVLIPVEVLVAKGAYHGATFVVSMLLSLLLVVSGSGLFGGNVWALRLSLLYTKITPWALALITLAIFPLASYVYYVTNRIDPDAMTATQEAGLFSIMFAMHLVVFAMNFTHCAFMRHTMTTEKVLCWFEAAGWEGDDGPDGEVV